ncbi:ER membrane protein complex subunit 10 [Armadillidium vulgare]|nr:ER membrane protein complex subunit 10 [Armadillidium vulgare]
MKEIGVLIISLCLFVITSCFQDDTFLDGQLTLHVEDTLESKGPDTFSPRSVITIRSVKSGSAVVKHTREWTDSHQNYLRELAINDGLYRVRVQQKGQEDRGYISTFTKACLLYESSLSETFTVMLDNSGGSIIGFSLVTPVTVCQGDESLPLLNNFNTTVVTRSPLQAPAPDTATYIQRLENMKTEKAEGKDNRSFLGKYWIYIIPIVIILVVSGSGQEAAGR